MSQRGIAPWNFQLGQASHYRSREREFAKETADLEGPAKPRLDKRGYGLCGPFTTRMQFSVP